MTTHHRGATRILLWVMSTLTVLVLLFGYRTSLGGSDVAAGSETPIVGSVSTSTGSSSGSSSGSTGAAGDSSAVSPDTATRTITGPAAQTHYGPVQVELTVTGSGSDITITDVSVIQYPHNDGRDAQINGYALPILIQETIDQQSASVDMVSGATYTSVGYQTSLQAAIDQAQA
ncbi:FMN-binding protein [soil metagenome]